jgi:hypothetical protein
MISRSAARNIERASRIRRKFEEGAKLKRKLGSDKIFNFG